MDVVGEGEPKQEEEEEEDARRAYRGPCVEMPRCPRREERRRCGRFAAPLHIPDARWCSRRCPADHRSTRQLTNIYYVRTHTLSSHALYDFVPHVYVFS
ncbi:hypothetical protein FKP32DRAFT_1595530 [Trametes sanguinea]|nr:hypothetical protein FKP32DRAFT_1595530 [Trametes sanguinea]